MKKLLSILLASAALLQVAQVQAQDKEKYKKGRVISAHFTLHDFETAADLKAGGLSQVLLDKQWSKISRMKAGFALSDTRGLASNIDLMSRIGGASMENPVPGKVSDGKNKLYLEADMNLHFKLLTDNYALVPYISAGAGGSVWGGYFGAYAPVGLGLQGHFGKVYVFLQAQYRFSVTQNVANHLFYGLGVGYTLPGKKAVVVIPPPPPPPAPKDTDGDGIVDSLDACPTVAGLAQFQGCPDTDKDGIKDSEDKCPTTPGLARYNGCPIPDTDGDGINDEEDKCPTVAGLARYAGCPIPDTDGDGINDELDKCPNVAGTAANLGCPELVVYYKRNESKLDANDKAQLDKVAAFLTAHEGFNVIVEGHTSTLGDAKYNQTLSEKRATESVKYLVSKGVNPARLKPQGFGEQFPIGDNSKEEGRAQSRRVVIHVQQ